MSSSTVIDTVQKNSTFIQDLGTNITDFARNVTSVGGRVFTSAAAQGGSFARAVVDRSPIGVIVGGVLFALANAKMAHTEWNRTSDEYNPKRMFAHVALGTLGAGLAVYTAAGIYRVAVPQPVMVDLREVNNTVAANLTNATAVQNITNITLPEVSSVVADVANTTLADVAAQTVPSAPSFFDNRTMSAFRDYVAPISDTGTCQLPIDPQPFFVPTPIPAQEAPGMFEPVSSLYSWLRDKVKRD